MAWTVVRYFPLWALLICVTSVCTRAEYSIILILGKLQKQHSVFPKVLPPGFWFSARTCKNGYLPDSLWAEMASKGICERGHLRSPSPGFCDDFRETSWRYKTLFEPLGPLGTWDASYKRPNLISMCRQEPRLWKKTKNKLKFIPICCC